jgi:hypothetical protein
MRIAMPKQQDPGVDIVAVERWHQTPLQHQVSLELLVVFAPTSLRWFRSIITLPASLLRRHTAHVCMYRRHFHLFRIITHQCHHPPARRRRASVPPPPGASHHDFLSTGCPYTYVMIFDNVGVVACLWHVVNSTFFGLS